MRTDITKEWSRYDPSYGYEKKMQDIKLFNGDIIYCCWPNAGFWNICQEEFNSKYYGRDDIKVSEAEFVRRTHTKFFDE